MRNLVVSVHMSLDGFVCGPNGEMDWIHVDEELFNYIVNLTNQADSAIYGRVTFQMMDAYWPKAGEQPNASKHDKDHSLWYNRVEKYVLSNTMVSSKDKISVLSGDIASKVKAIKSKQGQNIQMFGSPSAAKSLMSLDLVDELWIFVNPILLGKGKSLFTDFDTPKRLELIESQVFTSGIIELHYRVKH